MRCRRRSGDHLLGGSGKRERPALIRCGTDCRRLVNALQLKGAGGTIIHRDGRLTGLASPLRSIVPRNRQFHIKSRRAVALKPCQRPWVALVGHELWCGGRATDRGRIRRVETLTPSSSASWNENVNPVSFQVELISRSAQDIAHI
jgi:hypothetical protein